MLQTIDTVDKTVTDLEFAKAAKCPTCEQQLLDETRLGHLLDKATARQMLDNNFTEHAYR